MRKFRFHLVFALCFGAGVTALSWFIGSPDSPLAASPPNGLDEFFTYAQIIAMFLAIVLSGNVHGGAIGENIYWMLVFVQWFLLGFLISFVFKLMRRRNAG